MGLDLEDFDAAVERDRARRARPGPTPGAGIIDEDVRGVLAVLLGFAERSARIRADRDRATRPRPPAELFDK
jgi:hypothetical protein